MKRRRRRSTPAPSRYNPITHGGYEVRTLTSNGFADLWRNIAEVKDRIGADLWAKLQAMPA